jgi:L-rhamnose mutarotase
MENVSAVYGPTNPAPEQLAAESVQRFASVIGLKPAMEQRYRELHAAAWPAVMERLRQSNIQNYSIYITELAGAKYLFSYFEYTGNDWEADSAAIAADPNTQQWWQETDPCQLQLPNRQPGANWTDMEMVFLMK